MREQYKINGVVVVGEKRGRKLGFPTANIPLYLYKKIPEGIYASTVRVNGKLYFAASFVGSAKTFHKTDVKLESYIFDLNQDIYGKHVIVKLYKKIRENIKFNATDELIARMKLDVEEIKAFFEASQITS